MWRTLVNSQVKVKLAQCMFDYHIKQDGVIRIFIVFRVQEVWEVTGLQLSLSPTHTAGSLGVEKDLGVKHKGVSLRFPKFVRRRLDKGVSDCSAASRFVGLLSESRKTK